jgi:hypothetical protein
MVEKLKVYSSYPYLPQDILQEYTYKLLVQLTFRKRGLGFGNV